MTQFETVLGSDIRMRSVMNRTSATLVIKTSIESVRQFETVDAVLLA